MEEEKDGTIFQGGADQDSSQNRVRENKYNAVHLLI
jgi:hypothetical protein